MYAAGQKKKLAQAGLLLVRLRLRPNRDREYCQHHKRQQDQRM